ncbi:MAG: Holliday junction resolvase RuvX [Burkholderiales bacterium]|nr:Holliday junction resolvase RuvX [Burkholderiales bacterium]
MPKSCTILAFDYGEARVGIAMGNSLLQIPHPLATISAEGMWPKIDQIGELITKWQPQLLIVGCPHAHDNPQKIQLVNTINNFAKRLGRKFNLPVVMINEDFSSAHASSLLNEQGVYGREQKGKLDQLAACSILQTYFSNHSSTAL